MYLDLCIFKVLLVIMNLTLLVHRRLCITQKVIICMLYPDLFGAQYTDKGGDGQLHEITLSKVEGIETLLKARKHLAYGEQHDYLDEPHLIGWTRAGDEQHDGCAVLISNQAAGQKMMEIGTRYAGKTFVDLLGHCTQKVTLDEKGCGEFYCPEKGVSVWTIEEISGLFSVLVKT